MAWAPRPSSAFRTRSPALATGRTYDDLGAPAFRDRHVEALAPDAERTELYLEGVHCVACVWIVEKLPEVLPGVRSARLDLAAGALTGIQLDAIFLVQLPGGGLLATPILEYDF